jgi:hypothetical protein
MNGKLTSLRDMIWDIAKARGMKLEDLRSLCLGITVRAGIMEGFDEEDALSCIVKGVRLAYREEKKTKDPLPVEKKEGMWRISLPFDEMLAKARLLSTLITGLSLVEMVCIVDLFLINIELNAKTSAERMLEVAKINLPTLREQLRALQATANNQQLKN